MVIPLDAGWSDIGDWESVWKNSTKDDEDNVKIGNIFAQETKNCYLRSDSKLVVGLGLENIIVIDTDDALLVANINHSQQVKNAVISLQKNNFKEAKESKKVYRPWGILHIQY